jgi:prolyl oligopeptidase PreP (S9A serine peptidase family)
MSSIQNELDKVLIPPLTQITQEYAFQMWRITYYQSYSDKKNSLLFSHKDLAREYIIEDIFHAGLYYRGFAFLPQRFSQCLVNLKHTGDDESNFDEVVVDELRQLGFDSLCELAEIISGLDSIEEVTFDDSLVELKRVEREQHMKRKLQQE